MSTRLPAEKAVWAGKWRGSRVVFLIKVTDAAQGKATAAYAGCKTRVTRWS